MSQRMKQTGSGATYKEPEVNTTIFVSKEPALKEREPSPKAVRGKVYEK